MSYVPFSGWDEIHQGQVSHDVDHGQDSGQELVVEDATRMMDEGSIESDEEWNLVALGFLGGVEELTPATEETLNPDKDQIRKKEHNLNKDDLEDDLVGMKMTDSVSDKRRTRYDDQEGPDPLPVRESICSLTAEKQKEGERVPDTPEIGANPTIHAQDGVTIHDQDGVTIPTGWPTAHPECQVLFYGEKNDKRFGGCTAGNILTDTDSQPAVPLMGTETLTDRDTGSPSTKCQTDEQPPQAEPSVGETVVLETGKDHSLSNINHDVLESAAPLMAGQDVMKTPRCTEDPQSSPVLHKPSPPESEDYLQTGLTHRDVAPPLPLGDTAPAIPSLQDDPPAPTTPSGSRGRGSSITPAAQRGGKVEVRGDVPRMTPGVSGRKKCVYLRGECV